MFRLIFGFFLIIISASHGQKVISNFGEDREKSIRDSIKAVDALPYNPIEWGFFADLNINAHNPDFRKLPGVSNCCPKYDKGAGTGFTVGALFQLPLADKFNLQFRLGYSDLGGELTGDEGRVFSNEDNSSTVFGIIRHTIDAGLSVLSLEPNIDYKVFGDFHIGVGFDIGMLMAKTFEQREEIISPPDRITYADGSKSYLNNKGDIPEAPSLMMALAGRIYYEFPLNENRTLRLVPEISYSMGLTSLVDTASYSWKINPLKIGLALKFSPEKPEEPPLKDYRLIPEIDTISIPNPLVSSNTYKKGAPVIIADSSVIFSEYFNRSLISYSNKEIRTDTIFVPKTPDIVADLDFIGLDENGNPVKTDKLYVEEIVTETKNFPLLNYIFFDDDSYTLPKRYKQRSAESAKSFDPEDLDSYETLPIYYDLLNIIGARLNKQPNANITITAINMTVGDKTENVGIPQKRAETIKNYLVDTWKTDPARIVIKFRDEKLKPNAGIEKIEENRRVEIIADDPEILKPLFKLSDTSAVVKPAVCRFIPRVTSEWGLKSWRVTAYQGSKLLKEIPGSWAVPANIDWSINREKKTIPGSNAPVFYSLEVTDVNGNSAKSPEKSLSINYLALSDKLKEQAEMKSVERYNLILFDLDKSEIRGTNKSIVEFMKNRIKPDSYVKITGYTDKLGNPEYNRKLSETRAKSTAEAMAITPNELKGVGGSELLYDNSIPEGRFYCRTVEVVITTKIK